MEDDLSPSEEETRKAEISIDGYIRHAARATEVLGNRWMKDAACAREGMDPEDWFPKNSSDRKSREAARICFEECPVRLVCLRSVCLNPQLFGIFGGIGAGIRRAHKHDYEVLSKFETGYRN
ncbi:WhiB family transcriptional regulator [Streptomyces sp. FR-108]|uniref:WhiB family transcriptional regulator n=1 Tax=Streptomyces sp. FR-108 TaxID=3416665 RepID=UPI003CF26596